MKDEAMIVKCLRIYNEHEKKIMTTKKTECETVGKCYQVLEFRCDGQETFLRIIPDCKGHPILVRACDYEVLSNKIPKNWLISQDYELDFIFGSERWINSEKWEVSFWYDWDENCPKALQCYEEEMKIIQQTDNLLDFQASQFLDED